MSTNLSETLIKWAATRNDEVVFDPKNGYYSFEIVSDAYEMGKQHNEESWKESYRTKYFENAQLLATTINEVVKALEKWPSAIKSVFVSHALPESALIFVVDESIHNSDEFIDSAYLIACDIQCNYLEKGLKVDISYIDDLKELNNTLLKEDGFDLNIPLT